MTPAKKPRTECCCHSVTAMMAAIVVPAGARSIVMMRACLVSGRTADFDAAAADRARDLPLLIFRAAERVATLVFDLDLVMGSPEVGATPSAAPPQPRSGKIPSRAEPEARHPPPEVATATLRSNMEASQF